jgi:glutamyl-tRNA synthetase
MEDLDPPRVVDGSARRILDDLAWLGLDWDEGPLQRPLEDPVDDVLEASRGDGPARRREDPIEAWRERGAFGPYAQSRRRALYESAIARLQTRGLVYPCDCSRTDIARVASAPHAGEEVVYPGTCRDADPARAFKRAPALRVRVPAGTEITIVDQVAGAFGHRLDETVGDFVLLRADGAFAYQLAVVVDDLAMHVTDVIRGADLLASTPRQAWLARALGFGDDDLPRWFHLPLVVDHRGERLQKRTPGAHVRALREAGVSANAIVGVLSHSLGLVPAPDPVEPHQLLGRELGALRPTTLRVPEAWARASARDVDQRVESDR